MITRYAAALKTVLVAALFICAGLLHAQSQLAGTVILPNGQGFTGILDFSLTQNASANTLSPCTGPGLYVPTEVVTVRVVSGVLQSPPILLSSTCTIPVGVPYNVVAIDSNGNLVFTDQWLVTGSTFDVGTAVSSNPSPTTAYKGPWLSTTTYNVGDLVSYASSTYVSVINGNIANIPSSSSDWQQLNGGGGGGSGTVTGQANGVVPLATGVTTIGAQSHISDQGGQVSITEPTTVSADLSANSLNKVVNAAAEAGATADVKLAACVAALPSGGTCDARGFGAVTQTLANASPIVIPSGVTLLCDPATDLNFTGTSTSVFDAQAGSVGTGCQVTVPSTFAGNVVLFTSSSGAVSQTVYEGWTMNSPNNTAGGVAFSIVSTSSADPFSGVTIDNYTIHGLTGFSFSASGGGWINSNHIGAGWIDQGPYAVEAFCNGGDVYKNTVDGLVYEYSYLARTPNMSANGAIYFHGTSGACSNWEIHAALWDMPSSAVTVNFAATDSIHNLFVGSSDGIIQEGTGTVSKFPYLSNNNATELNADQTNTRDIRALDVQATCSLCGYSLMQSGDATHTGSLQWYDPSGTRSGYCGYDTANTGVSCTIANGNPFTVWAPFQVEGNATVTGSAIAKISPQADIRANGAVIDGATDISAALQTSINQCNAANGNACTVLLPCTGPNGCYLANGSSITWNPAGSKILRIKQQGTLYLGSTFVMPQEVSWTCDAGGGAAQFQGSGANCAVAGKTTVAGTLGTAVTTTGSGVTFTPTYTSGSASNFNVNSAITVAGLQTCSATASRTSAASGQNTVFTLSSCTDSSGNAETGPRTPVGSTVTVTGCSDATFDITGAPVAAQDWPNNTETIYESGATSTATGCTVVGFDDNTFENVRVTAVSGGTFTATFAHKHAASDVWGMVTVAPLSGTFTHHEINGVAFNSMGGAALWLDNMAEVNLSDDAFQPNGGNGIAAEGIDCTGCWWGTWNRDSFLIAGLSQHCTSNCSVGYPWGIHFSQDAARSNGIGGAFIQISNSTIMAGIKVDGNGLANSSGEGPQIGTLSNDVFEQTNSGAVTVDPRTNLGGPVSVSMNYATLQDDFQNNNQYFVFGTDCCVVGFADMGDLTSFALQYGATAQGYLANAYWPKGVTAKGMGTMHNPGAIGNSTGLLTDGNTLLGNFAGANAGMAPNIVPQATLPVTLNPTCATCVAVKGPDGVANSATELQTSSGGVHESAVLGTTSVATYAGDSVIFGAYCKPGPGVTSWGSASGANWMMDLYTFGTDTFLNNTASGYANPAAAGAAIPLTNGTWQKCFAVAQIATGESTAHTLRFQIESPGSGNSVGNDFYDPFWLFVPGPNNPSYAGITQAEVVRWAEEMFKGYVPSGASTGTLYYNPAFALSSGPNPIIPANATLPYVGTKTYSGTGTPTDTCSATVNTGAIEVNATPTAYQCSNATASYAWNALGGGGTYTGTSPIVVSGTTISCPTCGTSTGNMTDGTGTTTAGEFPETTTTAHSYSLNTAAQVLTQIGAQPLTTFQTNGVNNTSQTALNIQNSTANAAGLSVTVSNPSAGNVKAEISGILNEVSGGFGASVASQTGYPYFTAGALSFIPSASYGVETASFTAANSTFYRVNCASACTATLPNSVPSSAAGAISIDFDNVGAGTLTIVAGTGPTYTGPSTVLQGQVLFAYTDGTNFFGSPITQYGTNLTYTGAANGGTLAATGGSSVTWPATHDVVISNSTNSPSGAAPGTAGRMLLDQGATADPAFEAMSGDCTLTSLGAIACTKTSGVSFGSLATIATGTMTSGDYCTYSSAGPTISCNSAGGGGMVYPGAGVPVSTGSAWGTSLAAPSSAIVGISDTQTLTNKSIAASEVNSGTLGSAQIPAATPSAIGGVTNIANVQFTSATTAVGAAVAGVATCDASATTVTMTGLATTSTLTITPSSDVSSASGWDSGSLYFVAWPSAANTISYKRCNSSASSITPAAVTWNVSAK